MRKDVRFHAYKVQLNQELKPNDHNLRRLFVNWYSEMHAQDGLFLKTLVLNFSDESHFQLDGFSN